MAGNKDDNGGRRKFFRLFAGKAFGFLEEISGHRNIPLNKLDTLPPETIEGIVPVFFKDEGWVFRDNLLMKHSDKEKDEQIIREFSEEELFIIQHFNNRKSLKSIATICSEKHKKEYQQCFSRVSSLFFELARLRVYHPAKVYDSIS